MRETFLLFVLQKHLPQSLTYVGKVRHTVDVPSADTVGSLGEPVREYIKSCQEFKSWGGDVDNIDFVVYQVRQQQTLVETP